MHAPLIVLAALADPTTDRPQERVRPGDQISELGQGPAADGMVCSEPEQPLVFPEQRKLLYVSRLSLTVLMF